MSTSKTIGGALGAIIVLIVAQILAQLVASLFVLVKIPEGICNIIAGIIYVGLAFVLSELFSKRLLKIKIENLGMPKFSIKAKWIIVGVLLPVTVKAVYLFFFSGKYVSSGMNSNQIFSILSAGIAFTGIAAGFVEEMVFRGVILNLLKEKWNIKVAVLIPSVLFGLVHIIGMDFSIINSLLVLIAGTMVGIMFSMVAIESGSVWNSGIVHSLWNILIIGGGLSISEKADEYSVMTYVLDSKDFVFTGGEFGIESSIIALLGYVIVTLAAICMIKKRCVMLKSIGLYFRKIDFLNFAVGAIMPIIVLFIVYSSVKSNIILQDTDFLSLLMNQKGKFIFYFFVSFIEEVIFRGIIFGLLLQKCKNKYLSCVIAALIFTLPHIFNTDNISVLVMFIFPFLYGIFANEMFYITKSIWMPTGFHWLWNYTITSLFLVTGTQSFIYVHIIAAMIIMIPLFYIVIGKTRLSGD